MWCDRSTELLEGKTNWKPARGRHYSDWSMTSPIARINSVTMEVYLYVSMGLVLFLSNRKWFHELAFLSGEIPLDSIAALLPVYLLNIRLFLFLFLEERAISRFGSVNVELFWYCCCTLTGILHALEWYYSSYSSPQLMFDAKSS